MRRLEYIQGLFKKTPPGKKRCSTICGSKAEGNLKVTDKISLSISLKCRSRIDPTNQFEFIPFR
jgi:hypothetical protein